MLDKEGTKRDRQKELFVRDQRERSNKMSNELVDGLTIRNNKKKTIKVPTVPGGLVRHK